MTDERLTALLSRLGTTEKVAREIIEFGEGALVALDAIAADVSRDSLVRRAASLAGHHIRDRALRSPSSPSMAGEPAANRFPTPTERERFIAELMDAGGAATWRDANTLVVALSPQSMRTAIFAIFNREVDLCGESFGGEQDADDDGHVRDRGQTNLVFWWD